MNKTVIGSYRNEELNGGSGNDTIDGRNGHDTLAGGDGDDVYIVPNSWATIVEKAGEGVDTVIAKGDHVLADNVENLILNTEAANSWAGIGNDLGNVITGNAGNNLLKGMAGNDTIDGGLGNDYIYGGSGDDVLIGGAGSDRLSGGDGADLFQMGRGYGNDTITDFSYAEGDRLKVTGVSSYTVKQVGANTVVDLGEGDQITLANVSVNALHEGWIYLG